MSIVAWPAGVGIRNIVWDFEQPAQVNRSEWTRKRQVAVLPLAAACEASFELVTMRTEAQILAWRAFIFGLRGVINSFRLPATEGAQAVVGAPVVDGGGQQGDALGTRGWAASTTVMKAGHLLTLNDQLFGLRADAVSNGAGKATLQLHRFTRAIPADGTAIEVRNPTALVIAKTPKGGWSADPGRLYGSKLEVEEAF